MEIRIRQDLSVAELWLTHGDRQDLTVQENLQKLCRELNAHKLRPVVYYSGDDNLEEMTSRLLCSSRLRMEQQKTSGCAVNEREKRNVKGTAAGSPGQENSEIFRKMEE